MTIKEALNLLITHGKNNISILERNDNLWEVTDDELVKITGDFYIAVDTLQRLLDKTNRFLHDTKDIETT